MNNIPVSVFKTHKIEQTKNPFSLLLLEMFTELSEEQLKEYIDTENPLIHKYAESQTYKVLFIFQLAPDSYSITQIIGQGVWWENT